MSGYGMSCRDDLRGACCLWIVPSPMPGHRKSLGKRIEPVDAFIAATAQVHDLTVVTRDTSAFKAFVKALDPWTQT